MSIIFSLVILLLNLPALTSSMQGDVDAAVRAVDGAPDVDDILKDDPSSFHRSRVRQGLAQGAIEGVR